MNIVADCEMSPTYTEGMVDDEFSNVTYELYINNVERCILPLFINPENAGAKILKCVNF